jgi:hypothetical protein
MCALRRILEDKRHPRELRHRKSEPVFTNWATHSTRLVIGKTPMILSVGAILCQQLRSSDQTSR